MGGRIGRYQGEGSTATLAQRKDKNGQNEQQIGPPKGRGYPVSLFHIDGS